MLSKSHIMSRGVVATVGLLALTLATPQAFADNELEVGGFLGLHIFSHNNEIGVEDVDDALSPGNTVVIGARAAYALTSMFSAEGELGFIPSKVRDSTAELLGVVYRLQLVANFATMDKRLRPFAVVGLGGMTVSSSEPDTVSGDSDFVFHGGAGFRYRIGDAWGLRFDGRFLFPPSSASDSLTNDLEVTVGMYATFPSRKIVPPPQDQDEDGLTDDVDNCPTEPEDKDGFQDEDGCPELDNDSDGIADTSDNCVMDPEDKDGFQDDDGCPDADNDADGIADTSDKCPMEPEDKDGFEDADGCPELDNDGDGLADTNDQCPNDAEDKDGFQDEDGCPDPDNDGDGVLDAADKCMEGEDMMETKNGYQDEDGCRDEIPKQVQRFTGTIKGITFETGKAVIRASSNRTLNAAVKVLQDYPDLRIEVSGHTDDVGDDEANRTLSDERAKAVVQYMVDKGVDASRLVAKGYGEDRPKEPIVDADGKELKPWKLKKARAANRRVEFKLLSALTVEDGQ